MKHRGYNPLAIFHLLQSKSKKHKQNYKFKAHLVPGHHSYSFKYIIKYCLEVRVYLLRTIGEIYKDRKFKKNQVLS